MRQREQARNLTSLTGLWALLNLIFAIMGVALGVIAVVRALMQKKRERADEREFEVPQEEKERKKRRWVWIITAIVAGAVGIIFFFLTEDMTKLMVLLDQWTFVNAVILALGIVGYSFGFKNKKDKGDDDMSDSDEKTWEKMVSSAAK